MSDRRGGGDTSMRHRCSGGHARVVSSRLRCSCAVDLSMSVRRRLVPVLAIAALSVLAALLAFALAFALAACLARVLSECGKDLIGSVGVTASVRPGAADGALVNARVRAGPLLCTEPAVQIPVEANFLAPVIVGPASW